jgi:glutamate-1-semialdehyde 2,1-aminomutase
MRGSGETGPPGTPANDVERSNAVMPGASLGSFRLPDDLGFVVARGEGATVWSTEGRAFVDYVMGSGPLVLGHAHPRVVAAVQEQAALGTTYYYLNEPATRLAERIVRLVPCAEAVRFCGSGTEATFYALRIARAATGRDTVLKFAGGYHGSHDYGLHTLGADGVRRETEGIPPGVTDSVLVAPFNDLEAAAALADANPGRIAAVIVEPVQRAIPPQPGFLRGLRELCDRHGALLVFDEVVTGFRLALGGAQGAYGVVPDLCALGKAMGGGLPIAAVAGSRELIELTAGDASRQGRVYMGNTLNGNPLACAAGLAALDVMEEEAGCERLAASGSLLAAGMRDAAERLSVPFQVLGPPSIGEPVLGDGEIRDEASYLAQDRAASVAFGVELLRRGIFVHPGFKMYLSTAHTPSQLEMTVETAYEALKAVRDRGLVRA